jgi:hypothetical protein
MSVRIVMTMAVLIVAVSVLAAAEDKPAAVQPADAEKPITLQPRHAELNFSFVWQEGDWGNGVVLSGRIGYLLDQHHEVGPLGSFIYSRPNEGSTYHGGNAGLFYRYNLSTYGRYVIPYVGVSQQWGFGDGRDTVTRISQIDAGVRLMLSPVAAVNVGMVYQRERVTFSKPEIQRTFAIITGVSVFPGPLFRRVKDAVTP